MESKLIAGPPFQTLQKIFLQLGGYCLFFIRGRPLIIWGGRGAKRKKKIRSEGR